MSKAARLQYTGKMEVFAETVTIISKNGISSARVARECFVMAQETKKISTK